MYNLKKLLVLNNMSIVVSIHQPSSTLLNVFDNLYVLAKNGINIYSGSPQELLTIQRQNQEYCEDLESSIELLIKQSSKGLSNTSVRYFYNKELEKKQNISDRCNQEKTLLSDEIWIESKNFKFIDMFYLFERYIVLNYRYYWKLWLIEHLVYVISGFLMINIIVDNIEKPDACSQSSNDLSAIDFKEKIQNSLLIELSARYIFYIVLSLVVLVGSTSIISLSIDLQFFFNEHRNGMKNYKTHSIFSKIIYFK